MWNTEYLDRIIERTNKRISRLRQKMIEVKPGKQMPKEDQVTIGSGRQMEIAVLFLDICSYSSWFNDSFESQKIVLATMNIFMSEMMNIIRDYEGEFEKNYTQMEHLVEMIIGAPFSDLTYYIGLYIADTINRRFGEDALMFRSQTALSGNTTKYEYISFKEEDGVHEINSKLTVLAKELKPVIESAKSQNDPRPVIDIKEKIDLRIVPLEINTKELNRVLIERFNQMSPLLQRIFYTIQSVIQ